MIKPPADARHAKRPPRPPTGKAHGGADEQPCFDDTQGRQPAVPGRARSERIGDIEALRDAQKAVLGPVTADSWSGS